MTSRRRLLKSLAALVVVGTVVASLSPIERAQARMFIGSGGTVAQQQSYGIFNVKDSTFGATGNGVMLQTGVMSSSSNTTHLSCANASWVSGDIGKPICVGGAGISSAPLVTTISAVTDGQHIILAASCGTTVANAVVHYGTDDTTAVQAAITACFNAGGGIVFFPEGIYWIGGALQNTSTQNAQLTIPIVAATGAPPICVALVGTSGASNNVGCCGLTGANNPPMAKGSILFTPLSGSGTSPSLIGCFLGSPSSFSDVNLTVSSLTCRSAYLIATPLTMINAQWANYAVIDTVTIDVDATDDQQGATAPTSGGVGISMPDINNGTTSKIRDCFVTGYYTGYQLGEHCDADGLDGQLNHYGAQFRVAYHSIRVGRMGMFRCVYPIYCAGGTVSGANKCPLDIHEFATEHSTTGWYQTTNDVLDTSNELYGALEKYNVIVSVTGYDNAAFSKNTATNFTCTALF